MNKNAIQRYAVWARTEMIAQVSQRAYQYGITAENFGDEREVSVGGRMMTETERKQRNALISEIRHRGYASVMEEVAYTWFNRLIALRFMEVNNYLPSHVRVFSDASGAFKPEILSDALYLELPGLEQERVAELIEGNRTDDLYRYLLLTQCNALNRALPRMFEEMGSYTELLLPNNILRPDGVIGRLVTDIPETDWTDQVQIIGWLYQYYNTEPKNAVFAGLKQNKKIEAKDIPAATQLFTPDWIVRYMVENSLGRLWLEGHPNDALKSNWRYYLDEAEQEPEVRSKLDELRAGYAKLRPEEIKVIDPCCGSGHIAVYMFDVLMQIYESQGWARRDAVRSILENNLYALDIDDRAAQLAYFAVMMKAREYDRRFLTRTDEGGHPDIPQPKVCGIIESAPMPEEAWDYFGPEKELAQYIYAQFAEAKTLGSAIQVNASAEQLAALRARLEEMDRMADYGSLSVQALVGTACSVMWPLVDQAEIFAQKYDAVVTNPPYMGSSGMGATLSKFVKDNYPDSKADLFSVFIERGLQMVKECGFTSMITMESWMFLSSFEKLRSRINRSNTIMTLVHMPYLGKGGTSLGINFGTDMAVISKRHIPSYIGTYDRIAYYETNDEGVPFEFPVKNEYYKQTTQDNFAKIPGAPVAYWVSDTFLQLFTNPLFLSEFAFKRGIATGNNDKFLRFWYEIDINKSTIGNMKGIKWFPYNKGGEYRKWYGNREYVVNWENDGYEIKGYINEKGKQGSRPQNIEWNFSPNISYSSLTSAKLSFRKYVGFINDQAGNYFISTGDLSLHTALALLNSTVTQYCINIKNSTLNTTADDFYGLPLPSKCNLEIVDYIVKNCISHSRIDWDSFETSWDFQEHPLVRWSKEIWDVTSIACTMSYYYGYRPEVHSPLEECFLLWQGECQERFNKLKANEEELNRIFIDIYGLQDELTPEVEDRDVTVRRADLGRDVRSLISYAVGCMFGRYSLDAPGLAYAGGDWDAEKYRSFQPDPDNIIPICDDDYFDDDITGRFVQWVEVVYGKETLEANLKFIADALGGNGTPREVIRRYFLNDFYADHLKVYQKRPIYWLFDSGKKNGFKALIYMHRYRSDLLARLRTDYVHEQQERYRTQLKHLSDALPMATASERVKLTKRQKKLQEQALELQKYEEKVHHLADQNIQIDLDDGVKINYAKFEAVLAKIK